MRVRTQAELATQRPAHLLGGLFTGLAVAGLALGTYPILAPLCVMVVVAVPWFVPRDGYTQFSNGAFAALIATLLFGGLSLLLALM